MNDKRGDAPDESGVVEQGREMDADQPDNSHLTFSYPGSVGLAVCEVTNVGTNSPLGHGIAQLCEEWNKSRSVVLGWRAEMDGCGHGRLVG